MVKMVAKSDISSKVQNRIANLPSAVTDTVIQEFVEDAHIEIENFTGTGFDTSDIPTKFQAVITDMALVKVIEYMMDDVVEESVSIGGDITTNYSEVIQSLRGMKDSLSKRIEKQLYLIGVNRNFDYTEP